MESVAELPALSFPLVAPYASVEAPAMTAASVVFCFTLPVKIFAPAMSRLSEGKHTTLFRAYMRIFTLFIYLYNKKFYSETKHSLCMNGSALQRFSIYFEYLVSEQTDVDDASTFASTLINCVGIRFFFVMNDCETDLLTALGQYFHGVAETKKKGAKGGGNKKSEKNAGGGDPAALYDFYKGIETIAHWYRDCGTYLGQDECGTYDITTDTLGEDLMPLRANALHPLNVFSFAASCLPGTHPLQRDYDEGDIAFAFPRMAFRVPNAMVSPIALLAVTLPLTTRWALQGADGMAETMRTMVDQKRLEQYYAYGYIKRNDLADLLLLHNAKDAEVNRQFEGNRLAIEREKLGRESVRALQDVWCDTAFVSTPIKTMSRWAAGHETWTTGAPLCFDAEMSYFGNMIATEMWHLEKDLAFSTTHTVFLRAIVCAMNAYWYQLKLHCNILMLGQGATGKSHILDTLTKVLIPGTTTKVSHQTDKAAAVDSDNNDHISLFHEAPPGFLGQGEKNSDQNTGSHILKDMLTSCEVATSTIWCDSDTGRRYKMACTSQQVGVHIMGSNERASAVPEALASRISNIVVDTVDRARFNVIDRADAPEGSREDMTLYTDRWRMRQLMVNMVEKAIYTRCIRDVDLTVAKTVHSKLVSGLVRSGLVSSSSTVRGKSYLMGFIRTLTIIHAVDKYANDTRSPGHNKPIDFNNLLHIQQYLVASEEITLFALSLCHDVIIDVGNFKVMEIFTGAFYDLLLKNNTGEPYAIEGRYVIKNGPENRAFMYAKMVGHVTGKSGFTVKMSPENIKDSYGLLVKAAFKGNEIITETGEGGFTISKPYLDAFFKLDTTLKRFVFKLDIADVMFKAFNDAYAHQHMPPSRKFVLGVPMDTQLPFLFETRKVEPVPGKLLSCHNTSCNVFNDTTAEEFITEHLENKVCGTDAHQILYSHVLAQGTHTGNWPDSVAKKFVQCHGIVVENKRRIDTKQDLLIYKNRKKQRLDEISN
jgi:hypothetical protein